MPLLAIFDAKAVNYKIYRLHGRTLRLLLNGGTLTFKGMLFKSSGTTIHVKNKVDNWIQQIYPQSVSSHNEKIADRASPGVQ